MCHVNFYACFNRLIYTNKLIYIKFINVMHNYKLINMNPWLSLFFFVKLVLVSEQQQEEEAQIKLKREERNERSTFESCKRRKVKMQVCFIFYLSRGGLGYTVKLILNVLTLLFRIHLTYQFHLMVALFAG